MPKRFAQAQRMALLLGSAFLLWGCGFQLKGKDELTALNHLYLEHDPSQASPVENHLFNELQSALQRRGVRVDFNAPHRLHLLSYALTPYQSALDGEDGAFYERTWIAKGRYLFWQEEADTPIPLHTHQRTTVQHRYTAYLSNDDAMQAIEQQLHQATIDQLLRLMSHHHETQR